MSSRRLRSLEDLEDAFRRTSAGDCDDVLKSWSKNEMREFADVFGIYYPANCPMADIRKAIVDKQNEIREKLASVGGSGLDSSGQESSSSDSAELSSEDEASPRRKKQVKRVDSSLGPGLARGHGSPKGLGRREKDKVGVGAGSPRLAPAEVDGDSDMDDEEADGFIDSHPRRWVRLEVEREVIRIYPDMRYISGSERFEVECWLKVLREVKTTLLLRENGLAEAEEVGATLRKVLEMGERRLLKLQVAHKEGWSVAKLIPDRGAEGAFTKGKANERLIKAARKDAALLKKVKYTVEGCGNIIRTSGKLERHHSQHRGP